LTQLGTALALAFSEEGLRLRSGTIEENEMWYRDLDAEGRELARECQAFLDGRLVDHLLDVGDDVPAWAWTNLLAHGTTDDLLSPTTTMPVDWAIYLKPWLEARAYLAGEVLQATEHAGPLRRVQRLALVPFELRLSCDPTALSLRSSDWVRLVLATIAPLTSSRSYT
jgi:hypothetical protein